MPNINSLQPHVLTTYGHAISQVDTYQFLTAQAWLKPVGSAKGVCGEEHVTSIGSDLSPNTSTSPCQLSFH